MTTLQPNSHNCFVCGVKNDIGLKLRFFETGPGEITVEHIVPPQYQGYPGIVHGGITAAMLDEVLGRVHMGADPHNPNFMYTAKLSVQYRKPVPTGVPIKIVGRAGRRRKRSAVSTGAIYGPDGELLADAEAILVNVPDDAYDLSILETLGWRVYSDEEMQP